MENVGKDAQPSERRPNAPRVVAIVLSWNGKQLTIPCLESLLASDYPQLEILLVDNASSDGTVEAAEKAFGERIQFIRNEVNLGFAGGNNVGIQRALQSGADFILLLNNDTTVDPDMVRQLVNIFPEYPQTGVAGPKIFYETPRDQIWYAGGEIFLARGTARHIGIRERDRGQYDEIKEVDYASGCALIAKREVFEKVGLLDPAYEAYFEDTDFCMRAKLAGYKILYVPRGRMWHKISSSTGGQLSWRKIKRKLVSSWIFFRRYSRPHHRLTIPLFFALDVLRIVFLVAFGKIRNTSKIARRESV